MSKTFKVERADISNNLGPVRKLKVVQTEHTPHWKRYASKGRATAEFTVGTYLSMNHGDNSTQLAIDTEESYQNEEGRVTAKRTWVTFDEATTRKLYEMLKEHFEK